MIDIPNNSDCTTTCVPLFLHPVNPHFPICLPIVVVIFITPCFYFLVKVFISLSSFSMFWSSAISMISKTNAKNIIICCNFFLSFFDFFA